MQIKIKRVSKAAAVSGGALSFILIGNMAIAWEVPSNLRAVEDALVWDSNAPSHNIYEDGNYIGTVHELNSFEPIFENSSYQVVAHDYGVDFTPQSSPFIYVDDDGDDDEDESELEFAEFEFYYELNNTDGDLGIHSLVDGGPWTQLAYEDLNGRSLIDVTLSGAMASQGLSEFFFESAEPTFDELDPVTFFNRFPTGYYEVEGTTTDGEQIESETLLSSVLPAAPTIYAGANPSAPIEGCEDDDQLNPVASLDNDGMLPIHWDPVVDHHPTLGGVGEIEVDSYMLAFETETSDLFVNIDASDNSFNIPKSLVTSGQSVKIEVIVRDDTHNQVATEACVNVL
jgi:hypothetical protein